MPPGSSINGTRGALFARRARATSPEIRRQHAEAAAAYPTQPVPDLDHCVVYNYINSEFYCKDKKVCEKDIRTGRFNGKSIYYHCHCTLVGNLLRQKPKKDGQHLICCMESHGGMDDSFETFVTKNPKYKCKCASNPKKNYGRTNISKIVEALKQVTSGCTVIMLCCRRPSDPTNVHREAFRRAAAHVNIIWVCAPGKTYIAGNPVDAYKAEILKVFAESATPFEALTRLTLPRSDHLEFYVEFATTLRRP